jgi:TRAP-type C4-dicarboxylate transport system permease small subunit
MRGSNSLVLEEQRHLKWRGLDWLEQVLMILCGIAITGFSILVMCDIVTRTIGHPWLWLQEATMTFFIYGIFIGVGAAKRVSAVRWGVAKEIVTAWVITIPAAGLMAAFLYFAAGWFG